MQATYLDQYTVSVIHPGMKRDRDDEADHYEQDHGDNDRHEMKRRRGEGPHVELRMLLQSKVRGGEERGLT